MQPGVLRLWVLCWVFGFWALTGYTSNKLKVIQTAAHEQSSFTNSGMPLSDAVIHGENAEVGYSFLAAATNSGSSDYRIQGTFDICCRFLHILRYTTVGRRE